MSHIFAWRRRHSLHFLLPLFTSNYSCERSLHSESKRKLTLAVSGYQIWRARCFPIFFLAISLSPYYLQLNNKSQLGKSKSQTCPTPLRADFFIKKIKSSHLLPPLHPHDIIVVTAFVEFGNKQEAEHYRIGEQLSSEEWGVRSEK